MKIKSLWFCSECGHKAMKWLGQCPSCAAWNTFSEEKEYERPARFTHSKPPEKPQKLKEAAMSEPQRISTGMNESDRLLGGGLVPGSLTLVGGDPGIGKSTLLLQLSSLLSQKGQKVLYVSAEESLEQITLRARRLQIDSEGLYIFPEAHFERIREAITEIKPNVLIIDSIQIVYKSDIPSIPGSVTQVREIAQELMHIAKGEMIATFIIGHVTKSGEIAGPRLLEHLVDTVLYFEGDRQNDYRLIRSVKNRFGPTDEIAVFQMQSTGLVEVPNPSRLFLEGRERGGPGTVIIPALEGSRALLIEVQALVSPTPFPTPSRRSTGIDLNRLALLIAVLEKRFKLPLFRHDIFVSVVGGLRILEPGVDLGLLCAIASSFKNKIIPPDSIVIGEVGLGGEIRAVSRIESRLKEAVHLGFKKALIPEKNEKGLTEDLGIERIPVRHVGEALQILA